ncbi:MAG TPA: protein translocase subunit SecF, partial [Blastococcus sp.]|nr:protein translocase subunit SecF [Blastococcus sp.]
MTRPSTPADDGAIPVGSDADEQQDPGTVLAESAASVDEDALVDAGLPRDGSGQRVVPGSDRRVSMAHRLYNGEAGLDVVGHSRLIYKITAVVMLIC